MIELQENDYLLVMSLIEHVDFDIVFAIAVIEKRQSGRIFVDDKANPSVTLIYHYCGMALLCGDSKNDDFNNYIIEMLYRKINIGTHRIKIFVYPNNWKESFEKLLGDSLMYFTKDETNNSQESGPKKSLIESLSNDFINVWERINLRFNVLQFEKNIANNEAIPNGFEIKRIDRVLLGKVSGNIIPTQFWETSDDFLRNGVGYCLINGEEIVSISFSAFITNKQIDIGIETNPKYRGKGMGIIAGKSMVDYCLTNGYEPIWGCRRDNKASYRLAQKLGFEEKTSHLSFWSLNR